MAKLLLLDDEPDALEWMSAALTDHGHQVRGYLSGRSALVDLDQWRPDLIIADILMPEMDGLAFARLVRAHGGPPVLFVSIAVKQAEALLAGGIGYVQKPATADEIRAAVADALGRPGWRATVLVVDDDTDTLELYRSYLESRFDVLTAVHGMQALAILRRQHVDLVIADVHMPVMNGVELVRAIRADPALAGMPVLVQTADRHALACPVWRELGVAHCIDKIDFLRWVEGHAATYAHDHRPSAS